MPATVTALAHHVPAGVYDNAYFAERLNTTEEWILARTGIRERRVAEGGGVSELIVPAARQCLAARGIGPEELDCIMVATITPDYVFPATAAIVQHEIGATRAWGFDLSAACSGFVYGLVVAAKLVESGAARRLLLCGADRMTTLTNYEDRTTAVLFGDAAAVALVEQSEDPELGLRDHLCRMDGSGHSTLLMPAGGSTRPASAETVARREHSLVQDGPAVFRAAVGGMAESAGELMRRNCLCPQSIDWLVPHQANLRIIQSVGSRLRIPPEKVMANIDRYGNTTAATIPLCLSEWHQAGRLRQGDRMILVSFGAGYTMGAVYLRWSVEHVSRHPVATSTQSARNP